MSNQPTTDDGIVEYGIEDKPPLRKAIPLGLQHVFAMFLGNVAPPLILAGAIGLSTGNTTFLVQMALIVAGIATIVQAYPIGPVGARLPLVMGTSFAFLGPLIGIGSQYGLAAVFGAALAASFVEVGVGFSLGHIRKYFPPLVSGIVVMLIGLTLIPVGLDYAAGGAGASDYGSFANLGVAGLVLVITLVLNQFFDGFLRVGSVFVAIVIGYIVAFPLGLVDLSAVSQAGWITVPTPLKFGIAFEPSAIITVAFLYVVTSMESIGDITGIVSSTGRDPTKSELRGGLIADGLASGFAAIFNAMPNTGFSQNVGLVNFTGVASRYVAAIGGVILVFLGFVPKVGALVSAMPDAVLGGGALIMFAMIFSSGMRVVHEKVELTHRNMTILAVSIGLGLAVSVRPEVLANFPNELQTFFGSGLITGGFAALILNIAFPGGAVGFGPTDATAGVVGESPVDDDVDHSEPGAPLAED